MSQSTIVSTLTSLKGVFKDLAAKIADTPEAYKLLSIRNAIVLIAQQATILLLDVDIITFVKAIINGVRVGFEPATETTDAVSPKAIPDFLDKLGVGGVLAEVIHEWDCLKDDVLLQNFIDTVIHAKVFNGGCCS